MASDTYRERLSVAWWLWPLALAIAAVLVTELAVGAVWLRHPLSYLVAGALTAAGLYALGRIRIAVTPTELVVDDARLPRSVVAEVHVLDAEQRRELLGQEADPMAFVIARPWVTGGVRVDLADPADPTPYWFVSSRDPQRLAQALRSEAPRS